MTDKFRISPLLFGKCIIEGNDIYVSSVNYNGLFAIDINSGKMRFIGKFLHQGNFDSMLFRVMKCKDNLAFIPVNASEVAFYDIAADRINEISLKDIFNTSAFVTSTSAIFEDELYIFPAKSDSVIIYNLKDNCISNEIDVAKIYEKAFHEEYQSLCGTDANYLYQGKIYVPCWMEPAIMSIDIKSKQIEFYRVPEFEQGFCALCGKGASIYALNRNGIIIEWDINKKEIIKELRVLEDEEKATTYRAARVVDQYLYLFIDSGVFGGIAVDLNLQSDNEELIYKIGHMFQQGYPGEQVYLGCVNEDKLYCYTDQNRYFRIDLKGENLEWIRDVRFEQEELKNIIFDQTGIVVKNVNLQETDAITVKELLQILDCDKDDVSEAEQSVIGEDIYKTICSEAFD